jgi:hypothetical protein
MQTFSDFELLVVGDGCTDDSEQVVMSFGDARIRWVNLPSNSGGQAVPNNWGIANSTGDYIAYLGHDDIWFPTHLESLVATIQRTDADIAGAVAILYGPPGSDVLGMTGVFASGEYSKRDMLVPSSVLHKRSVLSKIGLWAERPEIPLPVDVDFEKRAADAGAKIVSSGELTVFKFNAAWRRNAYLKRSAAEQEELLAKIRAGGDFRQAELIAAVRSFLAGKYVRIEAPNPGVPGAIARHNARYKGTGNEVVSPVVLEQPKRFYLDDQLAGFEWHGLEHHEKWGTFRWSGPSRTSTLEFPVLRDSAHSIRIHILLHFQRDISQDVELLVNGERLRPGVETTEEGTAILQAVLPPSFPVSREQCLECTIHVARTMQPLDLGLNKDQRWLGVAVNWVELSPVSNPCPSASICG